LLDLDDTLLQNPLDKFLPAYVHALADHLAQYVSPEKMIPQLMHATDRMISKADGCETLETTFDEDFYFPLGLQKEQLGEVLLDFYEKGTMNFAPSHRLYPFLEPSSSMP